MKFSTRAIHAGQPADKASGATIPPVSVSTTFSQASPGDSKGYEYARTDNPTRRSLEECLAALEEGEACAAFSSGMSATTTVLQTLRPGDGVVAGHDLYGGTNRVLEKHFKAWGLEVAYAASADSRAFERSLSTLKTPRLVWLETPTNPLLTIIDIQAVSAVARAQGALVVVDNTFATPFLQKPLLLGADLVVHSTTKYLGGHSDVVGGAVVARDRAGLEQIRFLQNAVGAVPGPWDCYLVLRGVKTLALRMERHCHNAGVIARMLSGHDKVGKVFYPGLVEHPGHEIAACQMSAMGGMISFELKGDTAARRFLSGLRVFALAESLGGVESLASQPATMTHASLSPESRRERGISDRLIRLSVGIEDIQDLLEDVSQALEAC